MSRSRCRPFEVPFQSSPLKMTSKGRSRHASVLSSEWSIITSSTIPRAEMMSRRSTRGTTASTPFQGLDVLIGSNADDKCLAVVSRASQDVEVAHMEHVEHPACVAHAVLLGVSVSYFRTGSSHTVLVARGPISQLSLASRSARRRTGSGEGAAPPPRTLLPGTGPSGDASGNHPGRGRGEHEQEVGPRATLTRDR